MLPCKGSALALTAQVPHEASFQAERSSRYPWAMFNMVYHLMSSMLNSTQNGPRMENKMFGGARGGCSDVKL